MSCGPISIRTLKMAFRLTYEMQHDTHPFQNRIHGSSTSNAGLLLWEGHQSGHPFFYTGTSAVSGGLSSCTTSFYEGS
jgi:hypothetical protein